MIRIIHNKLDDSISDQNWNFATSDLGSVKYEKDGFVPAGYYILEVRELGRPAWYVLPAADPRLDKLKMYMLLADIQP